MPRRDGVFQSKVALTSPRQQGITAAARNFSMGQAARKIGESRVFQESREWQRILWRMFDTVPEYRFAVTWVGNLLSKAILEVRENGKLTENQAALDALASLFGGADGHAEMFRLLGINFTVAGEAWIMGEPGKNEDIWRVNSAHMVESLAGDKIQVDGEELPEGTLPLRLWKPHPARYVAPDSPSRAVIPILAKICKLEEHTAAQLDSRLTSAGILFVPEEMELPSIPITGFDPSDPDGESSVQTIDGADGLSQRLINIASLAIGDRASAAALVPMVITAPGEFLEKVQHLTFWSGLDENAKAMREEAVTSLANGMDMPPEVLLGTADVNHWGAWQIEEASIKAHTEPLLKVILSSLTTGYLRPFLEAVGVENYEDFTFEADTSQMRLRPNRSKEALELYDRGELNGVSLRRENGFDESDMPTQDELIFWLQKKVATGQTTPAEVVLALNMLGVKMPVAEPEGQSDVEVVHEQRPIPSLRRHPVRSEPNPDESESDDARAAASTVGPNALVLACDQMVKRALERSGNRLKSRLNGKVSGKARDLYLSMPSITDAEACKLLEDAWDLDDFEYPGVRCDTLERSLNDYATVLLRTQKPHTRSALARHLLMSLAEAA